MKQTWKNICLIFFILLIIEAAGAFVFLKPYYEIDQVYQGIEMGKWSKTKEAYDKLDASQKRTVDEHLADYSAYVCEQYLNGEIDYEQTAADFDAINSIDVTASLFNQYMPDINHNEYKIVIKRIFDASIRHDSKETYALSNQLSLLQQRMSTEIREAILVELLNDCYDKFIAQEIDNTRVSAFCDFVVTVSYYDAYEYAGVIAQNTEFVMKYRAVYENAEALFAEDKYFEVMALCDNVVTDPTDLLYQDNFATILKDSYNLGKIYYKDVLDDLIYKDDKDGAIALMNQLVAVYGDDFDLTEAKRKMADPWQLAYIDYLSDMDKNLRSDLTKSEMGNYILEHAYGDLIPDSVELYDMNEDGIPEMYLFNSKELESGRSYVGCFVYSYVDSACKYLGFVNIKNFGSAGYMIGFPDTFGGRVPGDECSLVHFDGESLAVGSYCQEIDGKYYVDGAEVDELEFLPKRTDILAYAIEKNISNVKYASMEDFENFILAYQK